jgi:beta-lactam-binding protein with PASTA domain
MTTSEFFAKFKSKYLWGNLAAMAATVLLLCLGTVYGLDLYTHHGQAVTIPNLQHKSYDDAEQILSDMGLKMEVSDTGYVKTLPPGCILGQTPEAGSRVKPGHIVYVIINADHSPTITLPDVIDNSSLREAMAKLTAMGFKLGPPQFVPGEKDWVYGILVKGRHVTAGDKVSVDDTLIIQVGNGLRSESDSVDYIDPNYPDETDMEDGGGDPFEEVTGPPSEPEPSGSASEPSGSKSESGSHKAEGSSHEP